MDFMTMQEAQDLRRSEAKLPVSFVLLQIRTASPASKPNSIVTPILPKAMPLILHEEDEERWLRGELGDLVAPFPSQLMTVVQDPDPKRELTWSD